MRKLVVLDPYSPNFTNYFIGALSLYLPFWTCVFLNFYFDMVSSSLKGPKEKFDKISSSSTWLLLQRKPIKLCSINYKVPFFFPLSCFITLSLTFDGSQSYYYYYYYYYYYFKVAQIKEVKFQHRKKSRFFMGAYDMGLNCGKV